MPEREAIPVWVLGGAGYVGGELLRILDGHPRLRVVSIVSSSHAGGRVAEVFPHLAGTSVGERRFESLEDGCARFERGAPAAVFSATPHGASAALLDAVLGRAEEAGADVHAVDLSADFRFRDAETFAALYGMPHAAPHRLASFSCAVPEHGRGLAPRHAAQPGCFTTAAVLASYPLLERRLCAGPIFVSAVTGSSGSGRTPTARTHHPERRSTLRAYSPLAHRHEAEMRRLLAPALGGSEPEVEFVPHSGPFVRGIHATLRLELARPGGAGDVLDAFREAYGEDGFVSASAEPPGLAEVAGTNRCRLGVAVRGRTVVVTSVLDNLVKGAAGGGVQWMNRLLAIEEDAGLRLPGLGWY